MSITNYVYDNLEKVHYSVVKKKIVSEVLDRGKKVDDEFFQIVNDIGLKKDVRLSFEKEYFENYKDQLVNNKGIIFKMKRNISKDNLYGYEVIGDRWYLREGEQKKWGKPGVLYGYNLNIENKEAFKEIQAEIYDLSVWDSIIPMDGTLLYKVKGLGYVVKSCDSLLVLPYKESIVNYVFLAKKHWYKEGMVNIGNFLKEYNIRLEKLKELNSLEQDNEIRLNIYYSLVYFLVNISWLLSLYQVLYKKAKKKNKIIIKGLLYGYSYTNRLIKVLGASIKINEDAGYKAEKNLLEITLRNLEIKKVKNNIDFFDNLIKKVVLENQVITFVQLKLILILNFMVEYSDSVKNPKKGDNKNKKKFLLIDWVDGNRKLNVVSRKFLKYRMLKDNKDLLELGLKKEEKKKKKKEKENAAIR